MRRLLFYFREGSGVCGTLQLGRELERKRDHQALALFASFIVCWVGLRHLIVWGYTMVVPRWCPCNSSRLCQVSAEEFSLTRYCVVSSLHEGGNRQIPSRRFKSVSCANTMSTFLQSIRPPAPSVEKLRGAGIDMGAGIDIPPSRCGYSPAWRHIAVP